MSDTFRSPWEPEALEDWGGTPRIERNHTPGLSKVSCVLPRLESHGQANKGHIRRDQTSVPGVWGSELEDCSPSSVRSVKRALSSGGYRKSV